MDKEDFFKFLPSLGSILIFLGVLKLSIYYSFFNIEIVNYLTFPEILISFFNDIIVIVITLIVAFVFALIILSSKSRKKEKETLSTIVENNYTKGKKYFSTATIQSSKSKRSILEAIIIFVLLVIFGYLLFYKINTKLSILWLILLYCLTNYSILRLSDKLLDNYISLYKKMPNTLLSWAGYSFLVFASMICYRAVYTFISVKNLKVNNGVIFQVDDNIVISDNSNYYIGKTQHYLFVFNEKTNETSVYPMNRIKMLSFPKRKK